MRLRNTTTLELQYFIGKAIPKYAILSHRWDEEEVLFQDLQDGRGPNMPGYSKIQGCCTQARKDGWQYVWIDTCCIDKSSSAELSEAINSMYKWYKYAKVCYAFLSDVEHSKGVLDELKRSAWFTRGWTLQELLAPEVVVFFDKNWTDIGTKRSLRDAIVDIPGIRSNRLCDIGDACIAEKMSWASKRETTRQEDEAYCLMGIFDVHMPLLYGERQKAFQRLQHEIIKSVDDVSYLCHTGHHILARSPRYFTSSGNISLASSRNDWPNDHREAQEYFSADPSPSNVAGRSLYLSLFISPYEAVWQTSTPFLNSEQVWVALLPGLHAADEFTSPVVHLRLENKGKGMWTFKRKFFSTIRFVNLVRAKALCEDWIYKLMPQGTTAVLEDAPYPKSRPICIKEVNKWPRRNRPSQYRILINDKSHPNTDFEWCLQRPSNVSDELWTEYMTRWADSTATPLCLSVGIIIIGKRLRFRCPPSSFWRDHSCVHLFSRKTTETIMLVARTPSWALEESPGLLLLTWDTLQPFRDHDLEEAFAGREERVWKFDFVDRMSLPLKDGRSVSASLRHNGKNDKYDYVIDVEIHPTGGLLWPVPARVQESMNDPFEVKF